MKRSFLLSLFALSGFVANSQANLSNEFKKIYSFALQEDLNKVMNHLDTLPATAFSAEQMAIKSKYIQRFRTNEEVVDYNTTDTMLRKLLAIYQDYWKKALFLKKRDSLEDKLKEDVAAFLGNRYLGKDNITQQTMIANFGKYLKDYLWQQGYYAATGKTGGLFDLFIWKKEVPMIYTEILVETTTESKVVFIEEVVTMGWEEYATFGKAYPGGWATKEMLYCVRKAYDTTSENFKISYLKHEAQHFADYKQYPLLTGADLEYRAKLTELIFANSTRNNLLQTFARNASAEGRNAHAFANYCVMRDLSRKVFQEEMVADVERWKMVPADAIVKWSRILLQEHSAALQAAGAGTVKEWIQ